MFVDQVSLTVSSGKGGPGAVSFRREAHTPRGGPDGGDGGRGGHVYFRATSSLNSLIDLQGKKHLKAEDGHRGQGQNCTGRDGEDLYILVPVGTLVREAASGRLLMDLDKPGDYLFLKGGRGGKGNAFFKNSVQQAPEYAQPGEAGQTLEVTLELKLIADVGIIGLPNAGKSSFIRAVSNARPKVANYPFTTLTPHLGVVRLDYGRALIMADVPGLIRGAHKGVGLGIQFLKHIERTKVFLHLVDASGMSGEDPVEAYKDLTQELKLYDELNEGKEGFFPLSCRPQVVALNKMDLVSDHERQRLLARFEKEIGIQPYCISVATTQGLKEVIQALSKIVLLEEQHPSTGPRR